MGSKTRVNIGQSYSDPSDDYDDEFDDDLDSELDEFDGETKDYYVAEPKKRGRLSTRREIERRNELRELYAQFDEWEEIELDTDW